MNEVNLSQPQAAGVWRVTKLQPTRRAAGLFWKQARNSLILSNVSKIEAILSGGMISISTDVYDSYSTKNHPHCLVPCARLERFGQRCHAGCSALAVTEEWDMGRRVACFLSNLWQHEDGDPIYLHMFSHMLRCQTSDPLIHLGGYLPHHQKLSCYMSYLDPPNSLIICIYHCGILPTSPTCWAV